MKCYSEETAPGPPVAVVTCLAVAAPWPLGGGARFFFANMMPFCRFVFTSALATEQRSKQHTQTGKTVEEMVSSRVEPAAALKRSCERLSGGSRTDSKW